MISKVPFRALYTFLIRPILNCWTASKYTNTKALQKKKGSYNIRVSKFSDVAVGLSEDKLGFRDYADGVIAILESLSKEDTPFTIGIFGSWGSGKTSFMQIMRELLKSRGYETIFFKSWEYGNEEMLWIPFMIKVVDELFKDAIDKTELIKNIFLFSTDVVLQTYTQGKISAGGILNVFKRSRKTSPFKEWSDEDANIVIERVTKIEEFKKRIKERAEESPKGKIIIFIDDLDRIPEKIVEFLNSLKSFLDISGCIFVLGCDYKILDSALKQRYEGEIYEDYFDKIVQTEFYIPKISEQAIKAYLQSLTGWDDMETDECTQLVIHSVGGNPRKIKRVANATMLIKSVFEKRLATFLQAFERPKPGIKIKRGGEGKEEEIEEPMALRSEITEIFTTAGVFDLLFDKKVLFKLACMREHWPMFYEEILSDEEKQDVLIFLQLKGVQQYISPAFRESESKLLSIEEQEYDESKENLSIFLHDSPIFHGVEDLKTYLTLSEISSPEAGIPLEYVEPEKLPINLFNRYMLFELVNKGKVDERIIEEKINQMDWESSLGAYHFFIQVITAFGCENLLGDLVENNMTQISERITDSTDVLAIGHLLINMELIDKETTREVLNQTKKTYAEKIRNSTNPWAIGLLLNIVSMIDEETARELFNQTKETYAEKIRDSTDLGAIGVLFHNVININEKIAKKLLNQTKDTFAEKIGTCTDPEAIGRLLDSVRGIDEETIRELLKETKDTYAEKILASTSLSAIGWLLNGVYVIDENTARKLLDETKNTIAKKIRTSPYIGATGWLLDNVRGIDKETAEWLEKEAKFKSEEE